MTEMPILALGTSEEVGVLTGNYNTLAYLHSQGEGVLQRGEKLHLPWLVVTEELP